jgi:hypothetical protein
LNVQVDVTSENSEEAFLSTGDASQSSGSTSEDEYEDSADSSSSSSGEDSEQQSDDDASPAPTDAEKEAARLRAVEEARLLLRDNKDAKNISYLEEEVGDLIIRRM